MGPIKMWHALRDYQKFEGILGEKATMKTKVVQIAALLVTVIGTFGISTYSSNWVEHNALAFAGLTAAAQVLHALFPSIFAKPTSKLPTKLPVAILVIVGLTAFAANAKAQTTLPNAPTPQATIPVQPSPQAIQGPATLVAFGVSYNNSAKPAIAGNAMYCSNLDPKMQLSTYACTMVDFVPTTYKPLTVTSNVAIGIAQDVAHFGKVSIWMPTAAGFSWNGTNSGWEWTTGAAATVPIRKNVFLVPNLRVFKSSVSNGSGYQLIGGFDLGFGR